MNVRIRGIYTTALTERLRDEADVVAASDPIRERFDEPFPPAPHDAAVADTDDRQGVGIIGQQDAVETLADRLRVARDALSWRDPLPDGAVYDGRVVDTLGSGAVVDLGDGEGFLPYGNVPDRIEEGDDVRVQVADPRPPWSDDRAVLDAAIEADAGLVSLTRGRAGGTTEMAWEDLLPTDPPEDWGVRWDRTADDAELDALGTALDRATERAEAVDAALADAPEVAPPRRLTEGRATTWVWFGRESRFALDDLRRAVTATMPGHHRVKAGDERASAAVDFAEALCSPGSDGDFPFDVVSRQFGPVEGDRLAIGHGKPDGRLIVLGEGEVTDRDPAGAVTVQREMTPGGTYDALGVERHAGDVAVTKFQEGRWWYPTVYRGSDGETRGTYVNVCTPVELFPDVARYVDLHVDVVKHADGRVERVDDDELDAAVAAGEVPEPLAEKARSVATRLEQAL